MANPTAGVPTRSTPFSEDKIHMDLASTAQTYYVGEHLGMNVSGYVTKFDDTASLRYVGFQADSVPITVASGAANGDETVRVEKPKFVECKIASAAITDIGKLVYAKYSNEVQLVGTSVYGNVLGRIVRRVASDIVLVDPRDNKGAARTLAATGAQSLTKWDLNKLIVLPNTAAYTVTLPAIADTQAGDYLTFIKTTAAAFAVTLDGNAAETINGTATVSVAATQYKTFTIVSTGTEWVETAAL